MALVLEASAALARGTLWGLAVGLALGNVFAYAAL